VLVLTTFPRNEGLSGGRDLGRFTMVTLFFCLSRLKLFATCIPEVKQHRFVFSMTPRSPSNPSLFQNSAPKYKSDAVSQAQIEVSQCQRCAEPVCKLLKQTDIQTCAGGGL